MHVLANSTHVWSWPTLTGLVVRSWPTLHMCGPGQLYTCVVLANPNRAGPTHVQGIGLDIVSRDTQQLIYFLQRNIVWKYIQIDLFVYWIYRSGYIACRDIWSAEIYGLQRLDTVCRDRQQLKRYADAVH